MSAAKRTVAGRGTPGTGKLAKRTASAIRDGKPLNHAQERFIVAWVARRNATQAYLDSHPRCKSRIQARKSGSDLFRDPRVAAAIKHELELEAKQYAVSNPSVLATLAAMALTPISAAFDARGVAIPVHKLPAGVALAVKKHRKRSSMDRHGTVTTEVEVELHDKVAPLRLLGQELGMFVEKVQHTADAELLEAMQRGRARALGRLKAPE